MSAVVDTTDRLDRYLGQTTAKALSQHQNLQTVEDLLNFFPRRYLDRGQLTKISELPYDQEVTLIARVLKNSSRRMRSRSGMIVDVTVTDDTTGGYLKISFFHGWRAQRELQPGARALFSGKVGVYKGSLTLTNPDYLLLSDDSQDEALLVERPIPVYPATSKLPSWKTAHAVTTLLQSVNLAELPDPIPNALAQQKGFAPLAEAYRSIHTPESHQEWQQARRRFRYQEAFTLQAILAQRRITQHKQAGIPRPGKHALGKSQSAEESPGLYTLFEEQLPFELTAGQRRVGAEISQDLAAEHPMQRLLQGEVGSGKTLVALQAMLQVVDSGGQAALLAPTEVLATQHYQSLREMLGPLAEAGMLGGHEAGTQIALLTAAMPAAAQKAALLQAASGEAGIVIGTHALLSERVQFADLGLVVVDEQHRFGVEQRDALRAKAEHSPHLLVMTATPIPRTVAMTVFGDLETSVLDELPQGRQKISTHVVPLAERPEWETRLWQRAQEEVAAGHQVYVVCPKIGAEFGDEADFSAELGGADPENSSDQSEGTELQGVLDVVEQLRSEPALAGLRIEALHGRMESEHKAQIMADFAAGLVNVLVATTVIEVGVNVPNASLMVVLDADRFGISQLHQLRGRIGRGEVAGTALLVTRTPADHVSRARLAAVAETTDGFRLAEADLELRREGDILGAQQSGGRSTLRLLRVIKDQDIVAEAREDVQEIFRKDPDLQQHQELATAMAHLVEPDREAFLERS